MLGFNSVKVCRLCCKTVLQYDHRTDISAFGNSYDLVEYKRGRKLLSLLKMEILASLTVCIGLIGSVGLATLQGFPLLLAGIKSARIPHR